MTNNNRLKSNLKQKYKMIVKNTLPTASNNEGHVYFCKNNVGIACFEGTEINQLLNGWFKIYPSTVCNYPTYF